ncbi:hypothetical protein SAMN04490192_4776 [Pseudomonas lundensis]|nr:hypothetical protein SAMN04490192_4776 [Pseudomonas lundensis]
MRRLLTGCLVTFLLLCNTWFYLVADAVCLLS